MSFVILHILISMSILRFYSFVFFIELFTTNRIHYKNLFFSQMDSQLSTKYLLYYLNFLTFIKTFTFKHLLKLFKHHLLNSLFFYPHRVETLFHMMLPYIQWSSSGLFGSLDHCLSLLQDHIRFYYNGFIVYFDVL